MDSIGTVTTFPSLEVMTFSRSLGLFFPIQCLFIKTAKGKSNGSCMGPFEKTLAIKPKLSNTYSCGICFKVLLFPEETGK